MSVVRVAAKIGMFHYGLVASVAVYAFVQLSLGLIAAMWAGEERPGIAASSWGELFAAGGFLVFMAFLAFLVVCYLPALVWFVISELGSVKTVWAHIAAGAFTTLGIVYVHWMQFQPRWNGGKQLLADYTVHLSGFSDVLYFFALGGLGGFVYWSIAGRLAGGWDTQPVLPAP